VTTTTDILRRDIEFLKRGTQRAIRWLLAGTQIAAPGVVTDVDIGSGMSATVVGSKVTLSASGGGGGAVDSVTAGDSTITIGGTSTDPTVKVTPGTFDAAGAAAAALVTAEAHADSGDASTLAAAKTYADTGDALALKKASDLSDLHSASSARSNLGLGTAATHAASDFLQASNNLSDVGNKTTSFDTIAPASATKGDILVYNGTHWVKHTHGSDGQIVWFDSSQSDGLANVSSAVLPFRPLSAEILADSPLLYYKCNESSGTTLIDYGSAGANLTYQGTAGSAYRLQDSKLLHTSDTDKYTAFVSTGYATANVNPTGVSVPNGSWWVCAVFTGRLATVSRIQTFLQLSNNATSTNAFFFGLSTTNTPQTLLIGATFSPAGFMDYRATVFRTFIFHAIKDAGAKTISFYANGIFLGVANYTTEFSTNLTTPLLRVGLAQDGTSYCTGTLGHVAMGYGATLAEARIIAQAQAAGLYGL
jgi:hypothetical protein